MTGFYSGKLMDKVDTSPIFYFRELGTINVFNEVVSTKEEVQIGDHN